MARNATSIQFQKASQQVLDFIVSTPLILLFKLLDLFPYRARLAIGAFIMAHVISPVTDYRSRIKANLRYVYPHLSKRELKILQTNVSRNIGVTVIELTSAKSFREIAVNASVEGNGLAQLKQAQEANQGVILVSGHIGNYDAIRHYLFHHGYPMGSLYQAMRYPRFNKFYLSRISQIGGELFERNAKGMTKMIKHLKNGEIIALLPDQFQPKGVAIDFLGHPALTATSAAEMALNYNALLIPCYARRSSDWQSFHITFEDPVPHSDPITMTKTLNDSLGKQIEEDIAQWFWIHNRWKRMQAKKPLKA